MSTRPGALGDGRSYRPGGLVVRRFGRAREHHPAAARPATPRRHGAQDRVDPQRPDCPPDGDASRRERPIEAGTSCASGLKQRLKTSSPQASHGVKMGTIASPCSYVACCRPTAPTALMQLMSLVFYFRFLFPP